MTIHHAFHRAFKPMALTLAIATTSGIALMDSSMALASESSTASVSTSDSATTVAGGLHELQSRWANIQYQTPEARRVDAFEQLYQRAETLLKAQPESAELHTWAGIIRGSQAGAEGGLSALSRVKEARSEFEQALSIDPTTLDGSAYTSLGTLYHQVPGWPISFGDDDKARELLQKGLHLNPDGIDSNYFWGDFLHDQGNDAQARQALEKALAAAPRPGRETADAGRRQEIQMLLKEI